MSGAMMQTTDILNRCRALGFVSAGVADARASSYGDELREWLDAGQHGSMEYLSNHVEKRADPTELLPGARSIICVADRYSSGRRDRPLPPGHGRIARYARGEDYHVGMKKRLFALCDELRAQAPDHEFKVCVDTAPILEREHAARAGLGAIGKHTLLLQRGLGSYFLLGEIVTTLQLGATEAEPPDPCGQCTRCIDACPTDAITPWAVDATKCISYLTIEHRAEIEPPLDQQLSGWIFGCDICQEVCPHAMPTRRSRKEPVHDMYEERRTSLSVLDVLSWTEEDRREAFTKSSMKRAKLNMMKRNAILLAGDFLEEQSLSDSDEATLRTRIQAMSTDESEDALVRTAALQVMERLAC